MIEASVNQASKAPDSDHIQLIINGEETAEYRVHPGIEVGTLFLKHIAVDTPRVITPERSTILSASHSIDDKWVSEFRIKLVMIQLQT